MRKKKAAYKIGIYIRVSTQEQANNPEGSIRNQEDRLKQMVDLKNLQENFGEILETFVDEAKSGKDTNRPALTRMLSEIEKGNINLVMASELSRISRNIQDFAEIWNFMKDKECSFLSLRENFDTTTAAGEMVLYTLANLAQFERRQVSERVTANFLVRSKRGLYNGGPVPPGYQLIDGKAGYLEQDPEEAPVIKKCFEVFLEEETLAKTAKRLNIEKYKLCAKLKGGKVRMQHFTTDNVYRILTNKRVAGINSYEEFEEVHETKAVWKGIVTKAMFNKVGKILKDNRSVKKTHSKRRYPYILTGLVYCLDCGDKLTGKSAHGSAGKIGYYEHGWRYRKNFCKTDKMHSCSSPDRFPAIKVHEIVVEKISKLIQCDKTAKSLLLKANVFDKKDPLRAEIKRLESKKINADRKLEALTERLTELPKSISAKPLYEKMSTLQKQKEEIAVDLRDKRNSLKTPQERPADIETWREFLRVFGVIFENNLNPDQQTTLIKKLVHKIELGKNDLKIHYFVGEDQIEKGLAIMASPSIFFGKNLQATCSSSLTNGGRNKD